MQSKAFQLEGTGGPFVVSEEVRGEGEARHTYLERDISKFSSEHLRLRAAVCLMVVMKAEGLLNKLSSIPSWTKGVTKEEAEGGLQREGSESSLRWREKASSCFNFLATKQTWSSRDTKATLGSFQEAGISSKESEKG